MAVHASHCGVCVHCVCVVCRWRGGSCWGGFDTTAAGEGASNRNLCVNPAYFSPGQWRLFAYYLERYGHMLPDDGSFGIHSVDDMVAVLRSSIVWGYNLLERISCSSGLVSNWWTLPASADEWPWQTANGLVCHNSATDAGAYGPDAVRIPWRVAVSYTHLTLPTILLV